MLDPATTLVIANPTSASGRVGREWDSLSAALRRHLGQQLRIARTSAAGDATRLAREAIEGGTRTLLSLGGDGTHNEVVEGLMTSGAEPGSLTLGILPVGTGGDFRRLLGDSDDVIASAAALPQARAVPIDVGLISFAPPDGGPQRQRHYLNVASFGMGGLICELATGPIKRLGGKAAFFLSTVGAWVTYRPARLRVHIDGALLGEFSVNNVMVTNGQYSGGGMWHSPEARLDDGLLDVVVYGYMHNPVAGIRLFRRVYQGTHRGHREVTIAQGRHIRLEPVGAHRAWVEADGEVFGHAPAEVEVRPGALRLLNPRPDVVAKEG